MHELSLMQELRRQALAAAAAEGATRIEAITLRVGELAGVELEALRFVFPVVMVGSIAAAAELRIEIEMAIWRCEDCGIDHASDKGTGQCPGCEGRRRVLISGGDLRLVSLDVQ